MLTLTETTLNGRRLILGVQNTLTYGEWLVSVDDGKAETLYCVIDLGHSGFDVSKVGADDAPYRVRVWQGGGSCTCPDCHYRNRACRHQLMAREVEKRW